MKIGIISDTHDNLMSTRLAIKKLEAADCKVLIHCGDFCSPFMMKELADFDGDVHACFGNTDDKWTTTQVAVKQGIRLHGDNGFFELDAKKIAIVHFPVYAKAFAKSGDYDLVCYGHNHIAKVETIGNTLLVNPGEGAGGIKADASYAIYDTSTHSAEIFPLKE